MSFVWKSWVAVAFAAALVCVGCVGMSGGGAAAQTVEGQLRIVKSIRQAGITQVAWSPDGRLLAAALADEGYVVWDAESGRKVRELKGEYLRLSSPALAFTPDGKHLIVEPRIFNPTDAVLALWNIETGAIDFRFAGPTAIVTFAVDAASERLVVVFRTEPRIQVVLFDLRTWRRVSAWFAEPGAGSDMAMEPGGVLIALGGARMGGYVGEPRGRIWVHDVATGRLVTMIDGAQHQIARPLVFLGNSGRVASTERQYDLIRNFATNQMVLVRQQDPVRVWDVRSGEKVLSFAIDFAGVGSLVSSQDGRWLGLAGSARSARESPGHYWVWDITSGTAAGILVGASTPFGYTTFVDSAFSPDGRYVAVTQNIPGGGTFEVLIVEIGPRQGN